MTQVLEVRLISSQGKEKVISTAIKVYSNNQEAMDDYLTLTNIAFEKFNPSEDEKKAK